MYFIFAKLTLVGQATKLNCVNSVYWVCIDSVFSV